MQIKNITYNKNSNLIGTFVCIMILNYRETWIVLEMERANARSYLLTEGETNLILMCTKVLE